MNTISTCISGGDVLITLKSTNPAVKKKATSDHIFDIAIGVKIELRCYKSNKYVYIKLKGVGNSEIISTLKGVYIINALNDVEKAMTAAEFMKEKPTATIEKAKGLLDGRFFLKILLQSKMNPVKYSQGKRYSILETPPRTNVIIDLIPNGSCPPSIEISTNDPNPPQHNTPTSQPKDSIPAPDSRLKERTQDHPDGGDRDKDHAAEIPKLESPLSKQVTNQTTHYVTLNGHRDIIPKWVYEKDSLKQEALQELLDDEPFDVHFIHCDESHHANIIGAHKRILKKYPRLDFLVELGETTRKLAKNEVGFSNRNSENAPIIVDISYVSLPAFRAMMIYIYTERIGAILDNIPGMAITRSTKVMEYIWCQGNNYAADGGKTVLSMDLVFISAYRFDIVELFDTFSRLLLDSITPGNAISILVHTAEVEEFRVQVLDYINRNFASIFGQTKTLSDKEFEMFEDKELCASLREAIESKRALVD